MAGLPEKKGIFPEDVLMQKIIEMLLIGGGAALLFVLPSSISAKIDDNCIDCHTDTNAPQGAMIGDLWRGDCVSCHAIGADERIVTLPGGVQVPQVYHHDPVGDLAGGNFVYISEDPGIGLNGSRKGHDVIDLFPSVLFNFPPGFVHEAKPVYFRELTCAGASGCHGVRNQLMVGPEGNLVPRIGMAALKGVHHVNEDGPLKVADTVANSYRFLMGLQGLEHTYARDRWQNVTPAIHNEYFGSTFPTDYDLCSSCHVGSAEATLDSFITTPGHSMSGFCATCHSNFHAQTAGAIAFLRHPADYIIPARGEYAEYTLYEITAPVARPNVYDEPGDLVNPGIDLVMCLSCHVAHASPYDNMLRFDYRNMTAGAAGAAEGKGCFACHTSKGR
jgi:predicted CXXCH cytochrome family protein